MKSDFFSVEDQKNPIAFVRVFQSSGRLDDGDSKYLRSRLLIFMTSSIHSDHRTMLISMSSDNQTAVAGAWLGSAAEGVWGSGSGNRCWEEA